VVNVWWKKKKKKEKKVVIFFDKNNFLFLIFNFLWKKNMKT